MASSSVGSLVIEVVGLLRDVAYHRLRLLLQEVSLLHPQFLPRLHGVMESEYLDFFHAHQSQIPVDRHRHHEETTCPIILIHKHHYVATEAMLMDFVIDKTQLAHYDVLAAAAFGAANYQSHATEDLDAALEAIATAAANEALFRYRQVAGNQFVYLEFQVNGVLLPRVEIELFQQLCPRTCENFMAFCEGTVRDSGTTTEEDEETGVKLSYKGNLVHRIVPSGWIQAGDVVHNGQGDGPPRSVFGRAFADESFELSHNAAGIVSMANCGPHSNGSQFFITLAPCPWLDRNKGTRS